MVAEENLKAHLISSTKTIAAAEKAILALMDENRKLKLEARTMALFQDEVIQRLRRMERLLEDLINRSTLEIGMEIQQMINLDDLIREVEETQGAAASTKVLVKGLYQKIRELKVSDPTVQAKLNELASSLQSAQDELASAVEADEDGGGDTGATGATGPA